MKCYLNTVLDLYILTPFFIIQHAKSKRKTQIQLNKHYTYIQLFCGKNVYFKGTSIYFKLTYLLYLVQDHIEDCLKKIVIPQNVSKRQVCFCNPSQFNDV